MTVPAPRRACSFLRVSAAAIGALSAGVLFAQTPPGSASATPAGPAAPKSPPSEKNAVSYSLGVSLGEQLHGSHVKSDEVNAERLAQGVRDGLSGKAKIGDADRERIGKLLRSALAGAGDANHRAAAKFLAENGKKPDVVTTASGLQYKVLAAGSGDSPTETDEVTVNYRGTLLDGTEFDSSYKRGQAATLQLSHVIPGWREGVALMKPGAKYLLFVPPHLGYDLHAAPGGPIPPGALLIFEVELLSFKAAPAPAAQSPAGAAAPAPAPAPAPARPQPK